jgi:ribosomal protein S6
MSKGDKTIYEIGLNLISTISEEAVAQKFGAIKEKITSLEGEIISEEYPKMIKLAYEMIKEIDNKNVRFNSAYFGWVKFEMDAASVAEIDKMAKNDSSVLRYIIIKTVRENTIHSPKLPRAIKSVEAVEEEVVLPIDEEQVDQKIDELIEEEVAL